MILEIAIFNIRHGMEPEFEAGVMSAIQIFKRAKGCRDFRLTRSIETPSSYRLLIKWDSVEDHTIEFRGSQDYLRFRKIVEHCFSAQPDVEHHQEIQINF